MGFPIVITEQNMETLCGTAPCSFRYSFYLSNKNQSELRKIAKLQQYKDCSEAEKNAVPPAIIPEKAIILQCFANFKPTLKHLKAKPSSDCHATRSAMPKKVRGPGRLGECGSAAEEFELALCHLLSGLRREPRGGPTWEGWGWG